MDIKTIARLTGHTRHAVERKAATWKIRKWHGFLRELGEDSLREVATLLGNHGLGGWLYQGRMTDKIAVLREDLIRRADRGDVDWTAVAALAALLDFSGRHARLVERRALRATQHAETLPTAA
jgi:hypothetical protein